MVVPIHILRTQLSEDFGKNQEFCKNEHCFSLKVPLNAMLHQLYSLTQLLKNSSHLQSIFENRTNVGASPEFVLVSYHLVFLKNKPSILCKLFSSIIAGGSEFFVRPTVFF